MDFLRQGHLGAMISGIDRLAVGFGFCTILYNNFRILGRFGDETVFLSSP